MRWSLVYSSGFMRVAAPVYVLDEEERAPLHLVVNPPHVFSQDSDANQLHATQEQDRDQRARVAVDDWPPEQTDAEDRADDQHDREQQGQGRRHAPSDEAQP